MYINQRLAISVNTQNFPYPQKESCSICAYFLKVCRRLCSRPCWMEWRSEERCHWHPQNRLQSSTVYRAPGHLSSSSRMRPTLVVCNNVSVLVQLASSCCAEEKTQVFTVHDDQVIMKVKVELTSGRKIVREIKKKKSFSLELLFALYFTQVYIRFFVLCQVWLNKMLCIRRFLKLFSILFEEEQFSTIWTFLNSRSGENLISNVNIFSDFIVIQACINSENFEPPLPPYPRMLCKKSGWNWQAQFGYENVINALLAHLSKDEESCADRLLSGPIADFRVAVGTPFFSEIIYKP